MVFVYNNLPLEIYLQFIVLIHRGVLADLAAELTQIGQRGAPFIVQYSSYYRSDSLLSLYLAALPTKHQKHAVRF